MNVIFTRRSIREYETKPVEAEKLDRILRAAMQAPSAMNCQPWEFFVVTDPALRQKIAAISPYWKPAGRAPALIIPLVNLTAAGKDNPFWVQDLSASVQNILLQAAEEGLGTCWMGLYPTEKTAQVKEALALPDPLLPFAVLSVGYGKQENHFVDRFLPEKVHSNKY